METTLNFNLPLTFPQITKMLRQLPVQEKMQLVELLQRDLEKDSPLTHFASQATLAQDWLNADEEQAWQLL